MRTQIKTAGLCYSELVTLRLLLRRANKTQIFSVIKSEGTFKGVSIGNEGMKYFKDIPKIKSKMGGLQV